MLPVGETLLLQSAFRRGRVSEMFVVYWPIRALDTKNVLATRRDHFHSPVPEHLHLDRASVPFTAKNGLQPAFSALNSCTTLGAMLVFLVSDIEGIRMKGDIVLHFIEHISVG